MHLKKEIERLDKRTDISKSNRERDFLVILENLDSLAIQKNKKKQNTYKLDGKVLKKFSATESTLSSQIYVSSLKAKLSILKKMNEHHENDLS